MNPVSAGLLLFWGVYFSMAGSGNIVDLLTQHGYRGRYFRFSSKNYELLETMVKKHGTGKSVITALFVIIMSWEILSAATYLLALALHPGNLIPGPVRLLHRNGSLRRINTRQ